MTFNIDEIKTAAEIAESVATALAILLGGGWAFWKFVIQRESRAKIEFELELNILGPQLDKLVVEIIAKVTNKGLVRHWLTDFGFDLLYLPKDTPVEFGDIRINHQVLFQPLLKKRYWIPPTWEATFIDPAFVNVIAMFLRLRTMQLTYLFMRGLSILTLGVRFIQHKRCFRLRKWHRLTMRFRPVAKSAG